MADISRRAVRFLTSVWVVFALPIATLAGFYEHNSDELSLGEMTVPLLYCLAIAAAVLTVSWVLLRRDWMKASLFSAILLAVFFSYGYLYDAAHLPWKLAGIAFGSNKMSLILVVAFAALAMVLRGEARWATSAFRLVRVFAAVFLVTSLVIGGQAVARTRDIAEAVKTPLRRA